MIFLKKYPGKMLSTSPPVPAACCPLPDPIPCALKAMADVVIGHYGVRGSLLLPTAIPDPRRGCFL